MSTLFISGKQSILGEKELQKIFAFTLKNLKSKDVNVSLGFVSQNKIRELNRIYRKKDRVTDVLSFVYNEEEVLGEIAISVSKIRKQAKEQKISPQKELSKIFVHGLLHLLGFDHVKDSDEIKMVKKEKEILEKLWLKQ